MAYNMVLTSTGVDGLNSMLGGGFPEGKIMIVFGGPGSGKTIMSTQFLVEGLKQGEAGVYISMEEPIKNIKENSKSFGWDLDAFEDEGLLRPLDLSQVPRDEKYVEPINFDRNNPKLSLQSDMISAVKTVGAKRLVLDPLTSILIHQSRAGKKRDLITRIFSTIRSLGVTALITSEGMPSPGDFFMEQFLADGVILLNKNIEDYKLTKTMRIDKMRGMDFDDQPRRYTVTQRGFQVFHAEPVLI